MTPEERSRCMAAIKGRDTKPEILVRKYLHGRGLRYRVNNRKLPGSPDIVLKKYKTVVFIDGCFWHGHKGCKYYRLPQSNTEFWRKKITGNAARDYVNNIELQLAGWKVIRIWECQVKTKELREETLERLYQTITGPRKKPTPYEITSEETSIAAEPDIAP